MTSPVQRGRAGKRDRLGEVAQTRRAARETALSGLAAEQMQMDREGSMGEIEIEGTAREHLY